jgi:hypothetical protein
VLTSLEPAGCMWWVAERYQVSAAKGPQVEENGWKEQSAGEWLGWTVIDLVSVINMAWCSPTL